MTDKPLANHKIAVLVESQYIPSEIEAYQEFFSEQGAEVHLIARMFGTRKQIFVSEVEEPGKTPETLEVDIDLDRFFLEDGNPNRLRLDEYSAIIMSANYTSVRLRWWGKDHQGRTYTPRTAPAVQLFADAMRNPRIIKGALCHGLWILTPRPELLSGRKVICHEVVQADIENAGGLVRQSDSGIVVDNDLVTGKTGGHATAFAEAIATQIAACATSEPPWERKKEPFTITGIDSSVKKILVLLSEWGYWGEELVGPVEVFDGAGYEVDFVTPTGKRPNAITVSMDAEYLDPPLGRSVTSQEMADKVASWDDPMTKDGKRLSKPQSLADWFPERPYWSMPHYLRAMEDYYRKLEDAEQSLEDYDAILIVGGSGPLVDLANNQRVHDLILGFYHAGKPIAAECYGVACLAFARNLNDRKSILWGKHVTGHCIEYDYKDGTGFMKSRGKFLDFNMGPPPYPLEYILRDSTGPDGGFIGNVGHPTSVIVDFPFITGRSTPDSYLTGQKVVEVLSADPPLRRFGW